MNGKRAQRRILLAVAIILSFLNNAWGVVQFAVTDLGTLNGKDTLPYDINENVQVVGYNIDHSIYHAFRTAPPLSSCH
jgi:hypothetical protein